MNLELIIQSEVRKRKTVFCMLTHTHTHTHTHMGSRKMVLMNLFARQQCRYRHREQTYGHSWLREKEKVGGMEKVTWKCTLTYVKWIASGNLLHDSGNSNRGVQ